MKQKLLLLFALLSIGLGKVLAQAEVTYDNVIVGDFVYTLYDDNHAEMKGISQSLTGDVIIPATIVYNDEKYSVTKVNNITSIYYYDEESQSYVRKITDKEDYTKVASMTFEDGIESISDRCFGFYHFCKVINIPRSVKNISPVTLHGAGGSYNGGYEDEEKLVIPSPRPLFQFNDITFNVDADNAAYSSLNGALYSKDRKKLYRVPRNTEGTFVIPDGVESIAPGAFSGCPLLKEVKFPTTVKEFIPAESEDDASLRSSGVFAGCYSLESIEIPDAIEQIGEMCFTLCVNLKYIKMPKSLKNICLSAFNEIDYYYGGGLEEINWNGCKLDNILNGQQWGGSLPVTTLPEYVKNIQAGTLFYFNSKAVIPESITLPASIEKFEVTRLFSIYSSKYISSDDSSGEQEISGQTVSEILTPLNKLYVLMDFVPDIDENYFGRDITKEVREVRIGKRVVHEVVETNEFPQTWADQCTLYVPENLVEAYKTHAVWGKFPNIVGVEVTREIDPIEEATTIAFAENDYVNANETPVDLNNTVVNDTYFSINNNANTDGYYDATEQCIVISKATSGEAMQTVVASALGSVDFISNYTGMVIEVNGKGSITISAQTLGSNRLAVKIGSADAKTYTQTEKGDITVNYDVTENTYVYIYAVDADNQQQSLSMNVTDTATENAVKVYSITVTPSVTAIESVAANSSDAVFGKIYSIDGKRLSAPQKGLNIIKMSDGTTRKFVR